MESDTSVIEPINLRNPVEQTIKKLLHEVVNLVGSTSKIVFEDIPQDDPKRRQPNISEAQRIFQWTPTYELKACLSNPIEYFREKLGLLN